jgi:hypothetical protein
MKRIVHVVGRNGKEYNVPLTAVQAAFYLRLAAFKAMKDPTINFSVLVAEHREKELLCPTQYYNEASQENEYPDVV